MSSRTNLTLGVLICFALGAFGCAVEPESSDPEVGTDESALMNERVDVNAPAGASLFYYAVQQKTLTFAYERALKNPDDVTPSVVTQGKYNQLVQLAQKSQSLGEFLRKTTSSGATKSGGRTFRTAASVTRRTSRPASTRSGIGSARA